MRPRHDVTLRVAIEPASVRSRATSSRVVATQPSENLGRRRCVNARDLHHRAEWTQSGRAFSRLKWHYVLSRPPHPNPQRPTFSLANHLTRPQPVGVTHDDVLQQVAEAGSTARSTSARLRVIVDRALLAACPLACASTVRALRFIRARASRSSLPAARQRRQLALTLPEVFRLPSSSCGCCRSSSRAVFASSTPRPHLRAPPIDFAGGRLRALFFIACFFFHRGFASSRHPLRRSSSSELHDSASASIERENTSDGGFTIGFRPSMRRSAPYSDSIAPSRCLLCPSS